MKNEAEFKKAFKNSVRQHRGYSISLAAPMMPGIPDLYVILPGYLPVLIEAKWLGEVSEKFNRKLGLTEMQKLYLDECCKIHPKSALILTGYKQKGIYYAALKIRDIGHDEYENGKSNFYVEFVKKICDVSMLFYEADIPKLRIPIPEYVVQHTIPKVIIPPGGLTFISSVA